MSIIFNNVRAFVLAVLIHAAFVAVMVFSLDWDSKDEKKVNIVKATVVDEKKVQAEIEKLKKAEKRKLKQEKDRQRKAQKELDKIKKARKREEQKRKKEQQRIAKLKKKKAEEKKKAAALAKKRKQEQKKLEEQEKKLKQKQAEEKQRLAEIEKQRKLEEQRLAEAEMQRQLEEELTREKVESAKKKKEDAAREQAAMTEVEKFIGLIHQDVTNSWIQPASIKPGSKCAVQVKLIPGGEVADVKLSQCTGDTLFQKSVEAAVRRASPLPVPKDPYVFDKMRDIKFNFDPEGK